MSFANLMFIQAMVWILTGTRI